MTGEVRQLRDPLRTPESEYQLFVQRMLDLAAKHSAARQYDRSRAIVAALAEAEESRLRLVEPWLFADDGMDVTTAS